VRFGVCTSLTVEEVPTITVALRSDNVLGRFPISSDPAVWHSRSSGLKNGQLLDAAESAGFDVLITADQNITNNAGFTSPHLVKTAITNTVPED
jgi:hypothetical protein